MCVKYFIAFFFVYSGDIVTANTRTFDSIFNNLLASSTRPCNSFQQPEKPNFSNVSYRTCERKCLEYLWEMNNRIEEKKHLQTCSGMAAVIRGDNANPAEYPHMGAVGWRLKDNSYKFFCGSSLISTNFVLTAAHCTTLVSKEFTSSQPSIVRLGTTNIVQPPELPPAIDAQIKNIIVHSLYDPPRKYFDIALLELDRELRYNKFLQPACLWGRRKLNNILEPITVAGWGATTEDSILQSGLNANLKVVQVEIVKTKICNRLLGSFHNRNWWGVNHQICAGNIGRPSDTCNGDSGGPLQFKIINTTDEGHISMVIGVTNFGVYPDKCGQLYTPGLYTKVHSFLDWIESHVWPGEN